MPKEMSLPFSRRVSGSDLKSHRVVVCASCPAVMGGALWLVLILEEGEGCRHTWLRCVTLFVASPPRSTVSTCATVKCGQCQVVEAGMSGLKGDFTSSADNILARARCRARAASPVYYYAVCFSQRVHQLASAKIARDRVTYVVQQELVRSHSSRPAEPVCCALLP
jgi:uncharacterized membrane protein